MLKIKNYEFPASPSGKKDWPWNIDFSIVHEKNQWPKISIVTPSYNQGQYLEETIRSVLLQGYPNLEYIIMDGGSTDNSVEIIKKYEPWLTYWVSEKDKGQSDAINKGFRIATGDIMGWINSDDLLKPGALGFVAIQLSNHDKPAWMIGASEIIDADGNKLRVREPGDPTMGKMIFWGKNWFPQQSTFWNRKMWKAAGSLDINLYYSMDFALWVAMFEHNTPIIVPEILSAYRHHPEAKCKAKSGPLNPRYELTFYWTKYFLKTPYRLFYYYRRDGYKGICKCLVFAAKVGMNLPTQWKSVLSLAFRSILSGVIK